MWQLWLSRCSRTWVSVWSGWRSQGATARPFRSWPSVRTAPSPCRNAQKYRAISRRCLMRTNPISGPLYARNLLPRDRSAVGAPSDFEDWGRLRGQGRAQGGDLGAQAVSWVLEGVEEVRFGWRVDLDQIGRQVIGLPIGMIAEARLVLTDDLIREALRALEAGNGR